MNRFSKYRCTKEIYITILTFFEEFEKEKFTENMSLRQEKRRVNNDSKDSKNTEAIGEKDMEN